MPDQGSASEEHALIQEITAPLAKLPNDPVPAVAEVDFPIVLRGYDRLAVDAYVQRVSQLVAELNASRSPQAAVRRALERVGEDVSGILQRAHDTGEQVTTASRREAEDRLEAARREAEAMLLEARKQAEDTVAGARHRLTELDAETDRIWAERHRIVEDARTLAAQLLALAEAAIERFPAAEGQGNEQGVGAEGILGPAEPLPAEGGPLGPGEFGGPEDFAEDEEEDLPDGVAFAHDEEEDLPGGAAYAPDEEEDLPGGAAYAHDEEGFAGGEEDEDTGELHEPFDHEAETTVYQAPFDAEAESNLPGQEVPGQDTLPLDKVEPDDDDLREHDAE